MPTTDPSIAIETAIVLIRGFKFDFHYRRFVPKTVFPKSYIKQLLAREALEFASVHKVSS